MGSVSVIALIFRLLANQGAILQVIKILTPIIGELIGKSFTGDEVQPASLLSQYDTRWTQNALKRLGVPDLVADGVYGDSTSETFAAVKAFQASHPPLKVDGIAGVQTIATLESELNKLEQRVVLPAV